jgi:hypothetical protein
MWAVPRKMIETPSDLRNGLREVGGIVAGGETDKLGGRCWCC